MNKLRDKLIEILQLPFIEDDMMERLVLEVLCKNTDNTMKLFMDIQLVENQKAKEETQKWRMATESNMSNFCMVSRALQENKTSHKAKGMIGTIIDIEEGNIAFMIYNAKAYFSEGIVDGSSNNGHWWWDSFIEVLVKHRKRFEVGGDSRSWAEHHNHSEYIDLVLKQIDGKS